MTMTRLHRLLLLASITASLVAPGAVLANADITNVPPAYRSVAAEYSVPPALLYSVALTESGNRYHGSRLPWPWTVNHGGKGIYFDTRQEAYDYLSQILKEGQSNFDVGLMQVNWRWNKQVFPSLWEALDPHTNLRGGASILRENYLRLGTFEAAVGAYHSPGDSTRANAYRERVRDSLTTIMQPEARRF